MGYLISSRTKDCIGWTDAPIGAGNKIIPHPSFSAIRFENGKWVTDTPIDIYNCLYNNNPAPELIGAILNGILDFTGTDSVATGTFKIINEPDVDAMYAAAKECDTLVVANTSELENKLLGHKDSVVSVSKFTKSPDDYTLPYRICINGFYGKHNSKAFIKWYESTENHSSLTYWLSFFAKKSLHVGVIYCGGNYANEAISCADIKYNKDYLYKMSAIGASRLDISMLSTWLNTDLDEKATSLFAAMLANLDQFAAATCLERSTFKESARTPTIDHIYNADNYTNICGFNVENLILENRAFDCIIDARNHTILDDDIPMLIHNKALKAFEGTTTFVEKVINLVRNYNTLILGHFNDVEPYKVLKVLETLQNTEYNYTYSMFKNMYFPKPKMRVTFEMSRTCNANCSYCSQAGNRNTLNDDEQLANLDEAIKMAEKLTGNYYVPQIMGGEPSIWSDKLIDGIIERFKDKGEVIWFTNGTNRKSHFFTQPNSKIIWHVINWKGKKLEVADNENCTIIVTHQDVNKLEDFIKLNSGHEIYCNICSPNKETSKYATTVEDVAEINRILGRIEESKVMTDEEVKERQEKCKLGAGPICIDVLTKTLLPCRGPHEKRYSFEELKEYREGMKLEPSCEGCYFEYYR